MLPAIADLVGDPPLVDRHVGSGLESIDLGVVGIDADVVAAGRDTVDRGRALEEPDALGEEEILVEERADGAEIDDVAGELVVEGQAREDVDLVLVAAAEDGEPTSAVPWLTWICDRLSPMTNFCAGAPPR